MFRAYGRRGVEPDVSAPSDDYTALVAALRQISADQRRAIVLHHLCDLSVEEVARETGAPTGTVKARLARGRAALAGLLATELPGGAAPSEETNDGEATRYA